MKTDKVQPDKQIKRFQEAARQLEADESEAAFDEKLKGIVSEKPPKKKSDWQMNPKLHHLLTRTISGFMLTWFFAGFIMYPDAPIRFCSENGTPCVTATCQPDSYYGKGGRVHSAADFHRFQIWQDGLFVIWPIGIVAGLLLNKAKPKI